MALDHYVSQVHLKNFYSPALPQLMYAMRKSDLKRYTPDAQSVCRIEDGSTNAYLRNDRAIEEFLKTIEPNYNSAVAKLAAGTIDAGCIQTVAGFAAYISICTPAALRTNTAPLKGMVESEIEIADRMGLLPSPPASLGAASATELLKSGRVRVTIDPKFPQAIGIGAVLNRTAMFGNFTWEILANPFGDCPFFTSDNPIGIERTADPRVINKIIPLTPSLAVRIRPDITLSGTEPDPLFRDFRHQFRTISRSETVYLNELLARCAEDSVFFRDDLAWVRIVIEKNKAFRVETQVDTIETERGKLVISSQRVVRQNV